MLTIVKSNKIPDSIRKPRALRYRFTIRKPDGSLDRFACIAGGLSDAISQVKAAKGLSNPVVGVSWKRRVG